MLSLVEQFDRRISRDKLTVYVMSAAKVSPTSLVFANANLTLSDYRWCIIAHPAVAAVYLPASKPVEC